MRNNITISQLTLNLLFVSPFISLSDSHRKNNFNSFHNIYCTKSFYSFLYSTTNTFTTIKSSSFSKFHGQSPINIDSKSHLIFHKEQDDDPIESFKLRLFNEPQLFSNYFNISVTFDRCTFLDCVNENSQGGAISFRKESASLVLKSCIFIRCKSFHSSGAIYIVQLYNGYWLDGDVNITNSNFEECCDCEPRVSYVAGVIDAYVAKGDASHGFLLQNTKFTNCQFDKKNKITEAQVRLNANIIKCDNINFTNEHKIDASALLFVKYVQGKSSISYLNAFNQNGFSFFEMYDLESGYIHAYNINMINTTFTNFHQGLVLEKVAFFNIFFEFENCFFLDRFYAIDFTTICTDEGEVDYDLIEPVIIQIPKKCAYPNTYNIFTNKPVSITNQIDYTIVPKMSYDYDLDIFLNMPQIEETPSATPSMSLIPSETDLSLLPVQTTIPINPNDLFNSIQNNNKRASMKTEIIIAVVVGFVAIAASIIIIVNVILQKKRNSFQSNHLNNDENEDNSSGDDISSEKEDDNESSNQKANVYSNDKLIYELFYNPKNNPKQSLPSNKESLIHSIVNNDPFKDDIEEHLTG